MGVPPDRTSGISGLEVGLAQLRGEVGRGLEEIKGSLGILMERTTRTDEDVKQLRQQQERAREQQERTIAALRHEIEDLKKARWPVAQLGLVLALATAVAAAVAVFVP
ncbi:hypothetical protein ACFWPV_09685 [Streptomyces uncialis]|uniref:hypothetical protein n=1 Tax=Streptomyces uncialis TaxID=1048205 RepID=UPI00365E0609